MRRFLALLVLLAACQMQTGEGQAPDVAGLSDEAIEVTALGAALPTGPGQVAPEAAPPTGDGSLAAPSSGAAVEVQTPTDATPRPQTRPQTRPGEAAADVAEAEPEVPAAAISPEQRLCEKAGGQWAKVGGAGRICVHPTRDSGKSCRKKSDCKGECLAQSGTCSPIRPLMGCNEVLDNEGRRMTQCLQ